jgi:ribonuclease P protein component
LHKPICTSQFAQANLHKPICTGQFGGFWQHLIEFMAATLPTDPTTNAQTAPNGEAGRLPLAADPPATAALPRTANKRQLLSLTGQGRFRRLAHKGKQGRGKLLSLRWLGHQAKETRLGIVASGKVGKAVVRNRLRRQLREIARQLDWPAVQVMVVLSPEAAGVGFALLRQALLAAAAKSGLTLGATATK